MTILLNWLWQGGTIAVAAALMLLVSRRLHPAGRYRVWCAAAMVVLLAPALSLLRISEAVEVPAMPAAYLGEAAIIPERGLATAVLLAWAGWIAVLGIRTLTAFAALARLRRNCVPFPLAREARLAHWSAARRRGRATRLVVSNGVVAAAVLGARSPVIAVAPQLLEDLEDEDLDRVVMHEWAHVQRYDDLAHRAQLALRILAGWHPALWWIDRQLHHEREAACDETAARLTGSAKSYAACLARLASLRVDRLAALAAPGALAASQISRRTRQVLRLDARPPAGGRMATALMLMAMPALGVSLPELRVAERRAQDDPPGALRLVPAVLPARAAASAGEISIQRLMPSPSGHARRLPDRAHPVRLSGSPSDAVRPAPAESEPALVTWPLYRMPPEAPPDLTGAGIPTAFPSPTASESPSAMAGAFRPDSIRMPAVQHDVSPAQSPATPWTAAASAGVAVGRGSRNAAASTAGFFNRFGRKIAGVF